MRSFARVARPLAVQQVRQFSARTAAAVRPAMLSATTVNSKSSGFTVPHWSQVRYASSSGLAKEDIKSRVLDVLKSFEKVDPAKVRSVTEKGTLQRKVQKYTLSLELGHSLLLHHKYDGRVHFGRAIN